MSDNNSNVGQNENSNNIGNNEIKYYYENESGNVTYEDIDTCNIIIKLVAHSNGREINEITNHNFNYENNDYPNNNNIRSNLISNNRNINNNLNNLNVENNFRPVRINHSFNAQRRNNIFDNSNLNSEMNNDNNDEITENNDNNVNYENNIDDIFDQLTYAISAEKQNLIKDKLKFNESKNLEISNLQKERESWKESNKLVENMKVKESDILDLDIGGTQKITTARATLLKVKFLLIQYPNSALAAMFSGRYEIKQHNERYFIDRDGDTFINLINFLSIDIFY